jgi:N-methylhydantoinase B
VPAQAAAASYGDSMVVGISGGDVRTGEDFLLYEATVGGWGAWAGGDGQDALINNVNGSLKDMSIEVVETKYPLCISRYAIRQDSGGHGEWRGGNGVERVYEIETDEVSLSLWFERSITPAWGLFGGLDATPPEVIVERGGETVVLLKTNMMPLQRGDRITTRTGGGGGFGDPLLRKSEMVQADVLDGFVSEAAMEEWFEDLTKV